MFMQKTAYEMRSRNWSSDVCSSDLHAAAEHFQPARRAVRLLPGEVDFGRRLGEGEVARPEAHLEVALEERAHEFGQRALEVGEARVLVDQQALALVEHRRVGLVGVAAIDLSQRDTAQRGLAARRRTVDGPCWKSGYGWL